MADLLTSWSGISNVALSPCTRCQATPRQHVQADSCESIVNL